MTDRDRTQVPEGQAVGVVTVTGAAGTVTVSQQDARVLLQMDHEVTIPAGKQLQIEMNRA